MSDSSATLISFPRNWHHELGFLLFPVPMHRHRNSVQLAVKHLIGTAIACSKRLTLPPRAHRTGTSTACTKHRTITLNAGATEPKHPRQAACGRWVGTNVIGGISMSTVTVSWWRVYTYYIFYNVMYNVK